MTIKDFNILMSYLIVHKHELTELFPPNLRDRYKIFIAFEDRVSMEKVLIDNCEIYNDTLSYQTNLIRIFARHFHADYTHIVEAVPEVSNLLDISAAKAKLSQSYAH